MDRGHRRRLRRLTIRRRLRKYEWLNCRLNSWHTGGWRSLRSDLPEDEVVVQPGRLAKQNPFSFRRWFLVDDWTVSNAGGKRAWRRLQRRRIKAGLDPLPEGST